MRRRLPLTALILYALAGIADGAYRVSHAPASGARSAPVATIAIAFCAGLFWPIDIVARPFLMSP